MISIEQTKQIAEYIWEGVPHEVFEAHSQVVVETNLGTFDFDPIDDDADAMMVLKALRYKCKKRDWQIIISGKGFAVEDIRGPIGLEYYGNKEFNNESICLAYLAVMESK